MFDLKYLQREGIMKQEETHLGPGDIDPEVTTPDNRKPRGIQSVVIGFNILQCLADAPAPMSLKALSQATAMPASKLRFYLISFLELGMVRQDPSTGQYGLGPAALKLGLAALEKIDVIHMVRGEMAALAESLGFTVFLAVWGSHGPTIVDRIDGRNRTVLEIRVGSVLPLLTSASGRVFAAFMPKAATAAIARRERKMMGEWLIEAGDDLSFEEIRATRLARGRGQLLVGFTAVGSPVLDRAGLPVAVITVVGAMGQLKDTASDLPARKLLELTTRLSRELGWVES